MTFDYLKGIGAYEAEMIRHRRYLHQHPELSYEEKATSQYIYDFASALRHAEVIRPTETSVLVIFKGQQGGPKIGLRADIDALPLEEKRSDIDFKSKVEGVMHACGHDGHTAILMAACQWLDDHYGDLMGEVYCIFQHAEEVAYGGAKDLVNTGLLKDLDFLYGQHLDPSLPAGQVDLKAGPNTTNTDVYEIKIQGKGGHASQPHLTVDPVIVGVELLNQFQTIISRQINPQEAAVISNTVFQAGNPQISNVIPDTCLLMGSIRTFSDEVREEIVEKMSLITQNVSRSYGAEADLKVMVDCKSVMNDPAKTIYVQAVAEGLFPGQIVSRPPAMVGEDFAEYTRLIPSVFGWIGTGNEAKDMTYPLHHPKFAIDENVLVNGLKMMLAVVMEYSSSLNTSV